MDNPDLSDIETVLEKFKNSLRSRRDQEAFRTTTLRGLKDSIAKIQTQQHADRQLRDLNRLRPFLKAAEQYGEVIRLFCNSSEIMPFIWVRCFQSDEPYLVLTLLQGPMRFLLEVVYLLSLRFPELTWAHRQLVHPTHAARHSTRLLAYMKRLERRFLFSSSMKTSFVPGHIK